MEEVYARRPIEIGSILGETIDLMVFRAGPVFAITLITVLPARLLTLALVLHGWLPHSPGTSWGSFGLAMSATGLLETGLSLFGESALIGLALAKSEERPFGLAASIARAVRRLPVIIVITPLYLISVTFGIVALLIPGIMVLLMWSVIGPVIGAESTGFTATFRRSQDLTRGSRARIFALILMMVLGTIAFDWAIENLGRLGFVTRADNLDYAVEPVPFLFATVTTLLDNAFNLSLTCALYIALREREQGYATTHRLNRIFE